MSAQVAMGHDEHFLSRLDRVAVPQVEFALSLYNDAPLVRYILGRARVPEGATRVAISLDDPVRGPFLVVARDGGFVTCLGEGMSPGPHPVITRAELDSIADRVAVIRERMEHARTMVGRHGQLGRLMARLYEAGEFMGREEMLAIAAWQPILWPTLFEMFAGFNNATVTLMDRLTAHPRPSTAPPDLLRTYWHGLWSCVHLLTLLVMEGAAAIPAAVSALGRSDDDLLALMSPLVGVGTVGLGLRAAWIAARLHKPLLPIYKRRLRESPYSWEVRESAMMLAALAGAHARSRAEIVKVLDLADPGDVGVPPQPAAAMAKFRYLFAARTKWSIERDEAAQWESIRAVGRPFVTRMTTDFPLDHQYRFDRPEDVPDDLAAASMFEARWSMQDLTDETCQTVDTAPALARLPVEGIYFPRAFNTGFTRKWDPECVLDVLAPRRAAMRFRRAPVRAAPTPGRNDPCSCGSGKKYKKCHGA